MRRCIGSIVVLVAILAAPALTTLGMPGPEAEAAKKPKVKVVVDCFSNPERIRVRNKRHPGRTKDIRITQITSIFAPIGGLEPFDVNVKVKPGKNGIFFTGDQADPSDPRTLATQLIFNNQEPTEGVRVETTAGTVERLCGTPPTS